jgi:hypothetical protein
MTNQVKNVKENEKEKKKEGEKSAAKIILSICKSIASIKLTVVCLTILTIIIVWGTVYQADHGLYHAQLKFFHSWVFVVFGFIPFPGTVLVMFVLFINLVFAIFFRIRMRLSNIGNVITHLGIIVLLVGGFFTFYYSEESSLMLKEGETTNMSTARDQWEVVAWEKKEGGGDKEVYAIDGVGFEPEYSVFVDGLGFTFTVKEFYRNCRGSKAPTNNREPILNAAGYQSLSELPPAEEAVENTAGGIFFVAINGNIRTLLLFAKEPAPTAVTIIDRTFFFTIRKKKIPLPLTMTLLDFNVTHYPNSMIPKSYESRVKLTAEGSVEREVVISMNKPLRFANLTFFQSSYYIAPDGTEYTILAVVKNVGRLLPYFSSIIIFLGLLIHFLVMLIKRRKLKTDKG